MDSSVAWHPMINLGQIAPSTERFGPCNAFIFNMDVDELFYMVDVHAVQKKKPQKTQKTINRQSILHEISNFGKIRTAMV